MNSLIKFCITWLILLIFFPIGLLWIIEYNIFILNILVFSITSLLLFLMTKYLNESMNE